MCKTHIQSPMTWIQDGVLKFSDKEDGHPLKIIYKSKYFNFNWRLLEKLKYILFTNWNIVS